jgi:hypothetical protein
VKSVPRLTGSRRRGDGYHHDPKTLRDVWLPPSDYYDILPRIYRPVVAGGLWAFAHIFSQRWFGLFIGWPFYCFSVGLLHPWPLGVSRSLLSMAAAHGNVQRSGLCDGVDFENMKRNRENSRTSRPTRNAMTRLISVFESRSSRG